MLARLGAAGVQRPRRQPRRARAGRRRRGRVLDRGPARQPRSWSRRASSASRCCTASAALAAIAATQPNDRGRGLARQDDDLVDARADPARGGLATRASSSAARSTRSAPTPRTATASGSSSRPTRATARSCASRPEAAIVTNVEPDHLDHYGGFDPLVAAFERFVDAVPGPVVCGTDDADRARRIAAARPRVRTYGEHAGAHYRVVDYRGERRRDAASRSSPTASVSASSSCRWA